MSIANELKKKASELAAQRLSTFDPQIDGVFQCPRCWIEAGRRRRYGAEQSAWGAGHVPLLRLQLRNHRLMLGAILRLSK
jgi:hypothetical protein